jgi:endonuclease-3
VTTGAQRARVRRILARLDEVFGPLEPPHAADPLEELVLTVLSQHTSDRNAERAFADLRRVYPTWQGVTDAPESELARAIRHGGLANTKAPRIREILREVRDREGEFDLGRLAVLPDNELRAYLVSLPGVGPKTAAVVMSFSLGRDTLPVDTHVHRTTIRLGLVPAKTSADKADRLLHDLVPEGSRTPLHVGLIRLGREVCKAPVPRCAVCPLARMCPSRPGGPGLSG